jgi:hypothetical protein
VRRLGALALLAAALAACGDNGDAMLADAMPTPDGAINPDAPPANTFTQFVKNQINTNTSDTADPVLFGVFASLPDPDEDNPDAYADLFQ